MGGGGRRRREAMPSGASKQGLFKAVYTGSFGKHNAGVVFNYTLKRGARTDVTSSTRFSESSDAASALRQKGEVREARGRDHKGSCRDVNTRNPRSLGPAESGFSSGDAQAGPEEWSQQGGRKSATRGGQRRAGRLSLVSNGAQGQLSASPVIPVMMRPTPGARREHSQPSSGGKDGWHSKARDQCNSGRLKSQERHGIKVKICKKKVKSHCAVLKVITKMLEENEQLRGRLLQCSQKCSEVSQQTESVFGWI